MNPYGPTADPNGSGDPSQFNNGYSMYGKPGFWRSTNQAFNPFASDPYWGNPIQRNAAYGQSIGTRPFDAAAWVTQRIAAPAVAFGLGWGPASAVGSKFFTGAATGMGMGAGAGVVGTIGGWATGYGAGMALSEGANQLLVQPFARTRSLGEGIYSSFQYNVMPGMGGGVTGRGMSNYQAFSMGSAIDSLGVRDHTFSSGQYGGMAMMGMNAGLFDNVTGQNQIMSRVKSLAAQVKMITAISNDPSIQSAIQELAKLQMGGASLGGGVNSQAALAYGGMGMFASAGGVAIQRLMSGVGMMGQSMFGSAGMTPYLGMMAAGSAYSGFAMGKRMGLLSPDLEARLGGLDGATQGYLGAQISGGRDPYNMIRLHNQFFGGGARSGMVNNAAAFGASAARDPLGVSGDLTLYGGAMLSAQSTMEGGAFLENNAIEKLRSSGIRPMGRNQKYSPSQIAAVLKSQGMSDAEIQAYVAGRAMATDPGNIANQKRAFGAQAEEQFRATVSQNNAYGGFIGNTVGDLKEWGHNAADTLMGPARAAARGSGSVADAVTKGIDLLTYGSSISENQTYGLSGRSNPFNFFGSEVGQALVDAANSGGPEGELARKILDNPGAASKADIRKFLGSSDKYSDLKRRLKKKSWGADYGDIYSALMDSKGKSFVTKTTNNSNTDYDSLKLQGLSQEFLRDAQTNDVDLSESDEFDNLINNPHYAALQKSMARVSKNDRTKFVLNQAAAALKSGMYNVADAVNGLNINDVIKNPGNYTSDAGLIQQMKSAKTDAEKKAVAVRIASVMAGGRKTGRNVTLRDADAYSAIAGGLSAQDRAGADLDKQGKTDVDYGMFLETSTRLSNAAALSVTASNTMNQAAGLIYQAAKMMNPSGAYSSTTNNSTPGR